MRRRSTSNRGRVRRRVRASRLTLLVAGAGLMVGMPTFLAATSATAGASSTFRATLGFPAGQTVTVAPGTQGALQDAFVLRDGYLYGSSEQASGAWTAWTELSSGQLEDVPLTWVPGTDGLVQELLGISGTRLVADAQLATGDWTTWTTLGAPSLTGVAPEPPVYAPATAHSTQHVFVMGNTGHVYMGSQTGDTVAWTTAPVGGTGVTFTSTYGGRVTYAPGSNGSTEELFAFDEPNQEYVTWDSDGTWHTWVRFGAPELDTYAQGVTYGPGSNGSLQEMFGVIYGAQGYVPAVSWEAADGEWSTWESYGPTPGDSDFDTSRLAVAPGSNGSLQEIFAVATDTAEVYVDWESPSGAWSGWESMGPGDFRYWTTTDTPTTGAAYFPQRLHIVTYAPGSNGSLQEIFATSGTYTETVPGYEIMVNWENPGGTWSGWRSMGAARGPEECSPDC